MELITNGPVPPDAEAYVERQLDERLRIMVSKSLFVTMSGGRQTGKTSALYRLRPTIDEQGGASSYVDISQIGDQPEREWLATFHAFVTDSILPRELASKVPSAPQRFDQLDDYLASLAGCCAPRRPLVLLLDEVPAVPRDLRRAFFSNLRAVFNARGNLTTAPELKDVVLIFAGTFDPETFIDGPNSPFNVAELLTTSSFDFTSEQLGSVVAALELPANTSGEVFGITAGHPYLTNRVLDLVRSGMSTADAASQLFQGDANLRHMARRLNELPPGAFELAERIDNGDSFPCTPGLDALLDELIVTGLVVPDGDGNAKIRCELYSQLLSRMRILKPAATDHDVSDGPLDFLAASPLREHVRILYQLCQEYSSISPTVAAVSMGIILETVLLLTLEQVGDLSADIAALAQEIAQGKVDGSLKIDSNKELPSDWTLAQMVEIARIHKLITLSSSQISHAVRNWRNLVHPARLRVDFPQGVPPEMGQASVANVLLIIRELRAHHP